MDSRATCSTGSLPGRRHCSGEGYPRAAAQSMLQDDPRRPRAYGWSHRPSLPHAIFEIMPWLADRQRAAAVAATYVVGFRAAEGAHVPRRRPGTRTDVDEAARRLR